MKWLSDQLARWLGDLLTKWLSHWVTYYWLSYWVTVPLGDWATKWLSHWMTEPLSTEKTELSKMTEITFIETKWLNKRITKLRRSLWYEHCPISIKFFFNDDTLKENWRQQKQHNLCQATVLCVSSQSRRGHHVEENSLLGNWSLLLLIGGS